MVAPAEAPRGDHQRRDHGDADQREPDDVRLEPPATLARSRPRADRSRARPPLERFLAHPVADVVLVHVELSVEPQVVRVRAQEALDVRRPGQLVERLVLERAQILGTDLRALLELRERELLALTGFAEAVTDFEHGSGPF